MTYGHRRQAESLRETAYERGYAAGWHGSNGPLGSVEFERGYTRGWHFYSGISEEVGKNPKELARFIAAVTTASAPPPSVASGDDADRPQHRHPWTRRSPS